ncbi:MAG: hypothetical protein HY777_16710 [Betaproteobacteria bacterium]|nr:hypothetical protein [Betaproteobacteria bacterium]
MSTYATKRILAQAEQRMTIKPPDSELSQADRDEINRLVKHLMVDGNQEAPPDADPELWAIIHRLNDRV